MFEMFSVTDKRADLAKALVKAQDGSSHQRQQEPTLPQQLRQPQCSHWGCHPCP